MLRVEDTCRITHRMTLLFVFPGLPPPAPHRAEAATVMRCHSMTCDPYLRTGRAFTTVVCKTGNSSFILSGEI